ncbi:hypothetical protein [Aureivirga sp. CE67]|uniref:hypothetical protein n=1 Tax=Aureivirga sp. CE67 TaxID=1788983 RepID=UPI0018CB22EB|nr:hypothetical protein [Aureivirga sp. CE67]
MKKLKFTLLALTLTFFVACSSDDDATTNTQQQEQNDQNNDQNDDENNDDEGQASDSVADMLVAEWKVDAIDVGGDISTGGLDVGDIDGMGKNITTQLNISSDPNKVTSSGAFDLHATISAAGNEQNANQDAVDLEIDASWELSEDESSIKLIDATTEEEINITILEITETTLKFEQTTTTTDSSSGVELDIEMTMTFTCTKL